jgi:hypothetical protein
MGEMASQDHSRFRAPVWFDCCNISPPRAGSIHLALVMECRQEVAVAPEQSLGRRFEVALYFGGKGVFYRDLRHVDRAKRVSYRFFGACNMERCCAGLSPA